MADTFKAQIYAFIRKSEDLQMAVIRTSIQSMVNEAQTNYNKGGKMPVLDGFLTNSGQADINRIPVGESVKPKDYSNTEWNGAGQLAEVLARLKPGDIFYYGWTAEYAPYMENMFAFMRSSVQNWPRHVDNASRELRSRLG